MLFDPLEENWRRNRTLAMQFRSRTLLHISRIYSYRCIDVDLEEKRKLGGGARDLSCPVLVVVLPHGGFSTHWGELAMRKNANDAVL